MTTHFISSAFWRDWLRASGIHLGLSLLIALAYGMWTVAVERPVHLVFEIDRFRVVHAIDVSPELLAKAPGKIDAMPWTGPTLLSLRAFKDNKESMDATIAAFQGLQLGARPDFWQTYAASVPNVLRIAKPLAALRTRFPQQAAEIDNVLQKASKVPNTLLYVPMVGRKSFWTVFVDPITAEVVASMPLDSF
jgi:hypothetical protein